ncbi:MBL fold metallo-hydrolase RNA specificity domain-containing protein [Fimbriimonas ginsengisoli]|uniref:Metallo-beta-lactamase family protein, RNA-specific n=1 Tax=Fimbriimonas ginsengisoli Gsoil 348 TaxID=661478 RepID=A0A068NRT0_FIMGI|nr:MBL fold metallo-hydrolase [Fimbriimonas ginsengisoli]AIE86131.1 Metallo-beta-lactamase family protein, RNA-specific [Fimbriimonas ginsengisoli Gsoil 348]
MAQSIGFYGAAETVTGSRHLLTLDGKRILVDCGLFQGTRDSRELNWLPFPVDPVSLDAVVITHAHMDHIGWLPRLVAQGYRGPIYATPATIGLCRISLPDSARIQEEDARRANRHGSRHQPALPLYTEEQAFDCMRQFRPVRYAENHELPGGATFRYHPAGHILGSAFAEIFFANGERILMGGDLGRYDTPIIRDPDVIEGAEYLVVESTYGDRLHPTGDPMEAIELILRDAWQTGASVIVPSFAIGRTQELLYFFRLLQDAGRMPRIPVYIDSPMAVSATRLYADAKEEHDEDMLLSVEQGRSELEPAGVTFIRDREQSKALNNQRGPIVIIAGSGMANGGRVVHHLMHRISDPNNIVLFTGYQAAGTLGRRILDGDPEVRILGQEVPVRARIEQLSALSAHADQGEILRWLGGFKTPPRQTFIVHGEPHAQEALREKIVSSLGWNAVIPHMGETFEL